ncbi:transposase, MuDR, MULE transposase domain protein [Artemisia annua]|uniref:Transposase, MuDR, MULE transposase domain protein n=1 Tax=Artemisia annua TaxID=35608 RepID=A0A2U1LQF7_ARTAN|nr:transposase, MuDR, MULE transposase domain protein [Artemisia annua]
MTMCISHIVDAAHLKGGYKGTNFQAVGMEGNNQIVPIAYGICRGETGDLWSWWMSVLKECVGDNPNMVIISDRHPSIALSVRNEFPSAFHAICCRHLMMNLKLKNKKVKAYQKLIEVDPTRWARAHSPRPRYNYCTSNSVKSVNACTVRWRKLPVTLLTDTYRDMVQKWYFERRKAAAKMKYEITDWAADKVEKRKRKGVRWVVYGIDEFQYQVSDGLYNLLVNLRTNECDCRKWQLSGIPCGHVIAVSRFLGQTNCLKYVQDWFKKEKYQATYAESIQFVGNFKELEYPNHIHPVTPPYMNNPQPGRPKNTNRILSQGEEPTQRHCSRCNEVGHTRLHCKKSFVPDPPVRKGKKKQQEFAMDEQTYGQNSYAWQPQNTYPTNHYAQPFDHTQYASQSYYHNEYPSQQYDPNHYDQPFDHTQYASQSYYHNEYPSQQYDPNTNASQAYDQYHTQPSFNMSQPNETQTLQNDHQSSSHMYQQYDSQEYVSQHLHDHNTQGSNSWFNHFGF